ncbi:hypothetical protein JW805_07730 [Roseomonas aeriglobus]|nr:hypothetical protein [Roseomonas aeriglobus]
MRIFSAGFLFALASCGGPPDSVAPAESPNVRAGETGTPAGDPVERIGCAVDNAPLADVCTVDRAPDADGTLLTIRHPDGGFRRLRVSRGGEVSAADGAVPAVVRMREGVAEVALGDARYRLALTRP